MPAKPKVDSEATPQLPPVVFEDDQILVINKPAGLIVQDSHTHNQATLEQAIAATAPDNSDDEGLERGGIVHRLDKETSGLMVIAKTPTAQTNLQQQFKDRQVHKRYLAMVWGRPKDDHAIINAPINRHPVTGYKYVVMAGGREAVTEFWLDQEYRYHDEVMSLLKVFPQTGRTHQIRVHLTALRLPIVGDTIYGRRKDKTGIRQFLHAAELEFQHPTTGEQMRFEASLPEDLQTFLDKLTPLVK